LHQSSAQADISGTEFSNNRSGAGGERPADGGAGGGIYSAGPLEPLNLTNCTLSNNSSPSFGGGIVNGNRAALILTDSTLSGNSAGRVGGGIYISTGVVTITNSLLRNNESGNDGGGIRNGSGRLTVLNSSFTGNIADSDGNGDGSGGGIHGHDPLTVQNSSFVGNAAAYGGGIYSSDDLTVSGSTFSNNTASRNGGGIANNSGMAMVRSSTFSGNTAGEDGGGINSRGAPLALINSTLSDNIAGANGGGINLLSATVGITNSIVTNSSSGIDLVQVDSDLTLGGVNIIESGLAAGANVLVVDPQLGPLADNGGPTQTHLPQPGSPAIDAGNNAALPPELATDQRGFERIFNGSIDIGAVESGAGDIAYSISLLSPASITEGDTQAGTNATLTITRSGALDQSGSVDIVLSGTATRDEDYSLAYISGASAGFDPASDTLTFDAGVATAVFQLNVVDDAASEPDETVIVTLANPTAPGVATLETATGTLTIRDNDENRVYLPLVQVP
jgi:hypothetical protein